MLSHLSQVEKLHDFFSKFPRSDVFRSSAPLATEDELEKRVALLAYRIYNQLKFFSVITSFKTIKLIAALAHMYNSENYLGWPLAGRSVIEHSAVAY